MPQPVVDAASQRSVVTDDWWRSAVVYQVYIRSFRDADGNGVGDIAGIRDRLPYLARLGVDAIWINPWYPSPMADAGYDVSDYRSIDPAFGSLDDAEGLIGEARAAGIRVILDIVPNHTSDEHAWFQAALAGDDHARARYYFRPGKGSDGSEPPNDWQSNFGGPAWTRTKNADGTPGDWYLHLFAAGQPDLDWTNPEVVAEFEDVLRFWFDRGVDGFRIDVAHGLAKAAGLPDIDGYADSSHPAWDLDAVHDIYRGWRRVADSYDPPRVFVAEAWVESAERLVRYVRPDELHTAFEFGMIRAPFRAHVMRDVIDESLATVGSVGGASTWVLSNHDVPRHVTRYARSQPDKLTELDWERMRAADEPADLVLGRRRARAAAMLTFALPGVVYVYQGDELGLEEVEDLPSEARQDPIWEASGRTDPGRDGCRVPLPWSGDAPPYGFSPPSSSGGPWLPQPDSWAGLTAEAQDDAEGSMLTLYREALRIRRDVFHDSTPLAWLEAPDEVLAFRRGDVECWVNTGAREVLVPDGEVLLASVPLAPSGAQRALPADSAVWLRPS